MVVDGDYHIRVGRLLDIFMNPASSASIYIPWNATVAALISGNMTLCQNIFFNLPPLMWPSE